MDKKPTVLMILDGYGIAEQNNYNAISIAKTPNMDMILKTYPHTLGRASGLDVGLPDGQMGNSEVGHLNIGAGRIIYQELTRISKEIQDGEFFINEQLNKAIENCKDYDSAIHFMGLLSDGGVHSHITHLYALLELAKQKGVTKVYVHCFMDGRDTPPSSGATYVKQLEDKMKEIGVGKIASISGRYYAMDRDNRFERVEIAYNTLVIGTGNQAENAVSCMNDCYKKEITDEFILPTVIMENGMPIATIKENDSVIFFNFRPDRAREITRAFCDEVFEHFKRPYGNFKIHFVCFTNYDKTISNKYVAFTNDSPENTIGEYVSSLGLTQLRIAETEKYAHVTFFFNGGIEKQFPGEDRILIPSPKVPTYDQMPEMSAIEVTEKVVEAIEAKKYDLIILNYANPDMVGHTGVLEAAIKAIETVDSCVGKVLKALLNVDGQMFICADHGNAEKMFDTINNEPFTAHTINMVPFILVNAKNVVSLKEDGKLSDISPTLLKLMNIQKPKEMTGQSLVIFK